MIQISTSAANTTASGVETGPSAVGRSSQVMNVFNKAEGLLAFGRRAVHRRFLPGPSTRMTCNPPKIRILVHFGVLWCTKVYRGVPRPTLAPRPSFLHFPACAKKPVSKRLKKYHGTGPGRCWYGVRPTVLQVGWQSPEGWHHCRMAFPKHIELHRSGIFEPE